MSTARDIRFWRRLCQGGVALAFVLIPFMNMKGISVVSGNFFSFSAAGLNFLDPLAAAQAMIGGSLATAMLTGAGLVLLIALLLGRIFCGWLCPYGLASELVYSARKPAAPRSRQPELRAKFRATPRAQLQARQPFGAKAASSALSAIPFTSRVLVCAAGLVLVSLVPGAWLNQLSMPGWYSRALQHGIFFGTLLYGALSLPAMLLLEAAARRRLWCRYLCPQSLLLSLAACLPAFLRVRFNRGRCACHRTDRACVSACSLSLNPRVPSTLQRVECTNCGDCVDACRNRGKALSFVVKSTKHLL